MYTQAKTDLKCLKCPSIASGSPASDLDKEHKRLGLNSKRGRHSSPAPSAVQTNKQTNTDKC